MAFETGGALGELSCDQFPVLDKFLGRLKNREPGGFVHLILVTIQALPPGSVDHRIGNFLIAQRVIYQGTVTTFTGQFLMF